jgi:hypothetical protein
MKVGQSYVSSRKRLVFPIFRLAADAIHVFLTEINVFEAPDATVQ